MSTKERNRSRLEPEDRMREMAEAFLESGYDKAGNNAPCWHEQEIRCLIAFGLRVRNEALEEAAAIAEQVADSKDACLLEAASCGFSTEDTWENGALTAACKIGPLRTPEAPSE